MQRKSFEQMQCPIARSLERVGEWWSILIMRDAFYGFTRFDQFQKSLGIAPNMLTRRLKDLVDSGLMVRKQYSERPARYEYALTQMGSDFRPVVLALLTWGNKYFAPEGPSVLLKDKATGKTAIPIMVDKNSGKNIDIGGFEIVAGPAADKAIHRRMNLKTASQAKARG